MTPYCGILIGNLMIKYKITENKVIELRKYSLFTQTEEDGEQILGFVYWRGLCEEKFTILVLSTLINKWTGTLLPIT